MKTLTTPLGIMAGLLLLPTPYARAGFSLGDASGYAVLYEGSGGHNLAEGG